MNSKCVQPLEMERKDSNVVEEKLSHQCNSSCLGPLSFHDQAVGEKVSLSQGSRLATRAATTFRNGLVFSSRAVKIREKIRLKLVGSAQRWEGALRVGFTTVDPAARQLPLPPLAFPDLTDCPGHWAAPVPELFSQTDSELELWVSHGGSIYIQNKTLKCRIQTGVDVSKPLWAMIDVYGQTTSIFLLGSHKRGLLCTRRSCPAPGYSGHDESVSLPGMNAPRGSVDDCVVCMVGEASITLPCGHRCLCQLCLSRVIYEFGSCPLCRQNIWEPEYKLRTGDVENPTEKT
ncbi:E3 ubiquitin-protein ligase NEURL3-like [Nelusetta ayraudi]|uniref:E3 ubiquitin-protein ligase NEURL3-like n=1 Tax=Nelusetta ayraudi TaxID=303726 RepID=UPI003F708A25